MKTFGVPFISLLMVHINGKIICPSDAVWWSNFLVKKYSKFKSFVEGSGKKFVNINPLVRDPLY